jgi:hypothetical protein
MPSDAIASIHTMTLEARLMVGIGAVLALLAIAMSGTGAA